MWCLYRAFPCLIEKPSQFMIQKKLRNGFSHCEVRETKAKMDQLFLGLRRAMMRPAIPMAANATVPGSGTGVSNTRLL